MSLELLLAYPDGKPVLEKGLPSSAASIAPTALPPNYPDRLRDDNVDPQKLESQRWGLIVPQGAEGERLLRLVAPLRRLRESQQGGEPIIYQVPPGMDAEAAAAWKREVYWNRSVRPIARPRYLLILGDLDAVSIELQQVLAADVFVGRLAFDDDAGYVSYVEKLLRWEQRPAPETAGRALFYTAEDGSTATATGRTMLAEPSLEACQTGKNIGEVRASEILRIPYDRDAPADALLAAAASPVPSLLLTVSHGLAPPRSGFAPGEQRALQGAMCLGDGRTLKGADIADKTFLPGGLWLMMACYGGATPATSAYAPWLSVLREQGLFLDSVQSVLTGLPKPGDRPFIAALPKAALANTNGPLGVIAHADIAWSLAFTDLERKRSRATRFLGLLSAVLAGHRAGTAHRELLRFFVETDTDLSTLEPIPGAVETQARLTRRCELWMLRNDLAGYLLLGDPAARLPISEQAQPLPLAPQKTSSSPSLAELQNLIPFAQAPKKSASPEREAMEEAVIAFLRGEAPAAIATRMSVKQDEVLGWVDAYQRAGRAALDKHR